MDPLESMESMVLMDRLNEHRYPRALPFPFHEHPPPRPAMRSSRRHAYAFLCLSAILLSAAPAHAATPAAVVPADSWAGRTRALWVYRVPASVGAQGRSIALPRGR